ncbi:MAG: response regulator [Chitinispirillales bacterium]|nr:response regulator [Chitinispirillales bacterium]
MGDGSVQVFNMASLLGLRDFNVSKAAAEANMPIRKYFGLLSEIIVQGPRVIESLNKLSCFEIDADAIGCLTEMQKTLAAAGCIRYALPIAEIALAGKDGDIAHVAPHAAKVLKGFSRIFTQLWTMMIDEASDPYGPVSMKEALDKAQEEINLKETFRQKRILAVDDMPVMLATIGLVLKKEYAVYKLSDSAQLESVLESLAPDLFLLDYEMPQRSGFDLVPVIRGYEAHKATPIIFLTSTGTNDSVLKAIKLGACDYLVKPIQADTLRQKVATHITKK